MPRRFTVAEAQSLIPQVSRLLRDAVAQKAEYAEAQRAIQASMERIMAMGGMTVNRETARQARDRLEAAAGQLRESVERVQELGCLVKDLDMGLVDFPTLFRGTGVYLCWKLGEPGIQFWHGEDEGFAGRKPIDDEFLKHHAGEAPE
ncbi:MAG: DUF2203 domain-containing protein [Acidobacteriia bacterium]|nr:DUF2203 domain-containing protein [Terriglobia bacterium]